MSSPNVHLLNQVIVWLQHLHEKQKKGKIDALFDIKTHLCYEQMLLYRELILSDESLCNCAAKLFSAPVNEIKLIKKSLVSREYCSEITFEINNEVKVFFIKHAWEGAIKEALGLEFNNLLTNTPIRYLCGSETIITEKVFDPLPSNTLYELRESPEYIFAYGQWEVFTRILRLTDRKTSNVRWNGACLANIDFGLVFYKGKPVFDSRFTLTQQSELRKQGQIVALRQLLENFQRHQNKLEKLFLNTNVHFCRSILCSRIPREPLRVVLTALKEINSEMELTVIPENKELSGVRIWTLKSLLDTKGVLYSSLITKNGTIIDEVQSSEYSDNDKSVNLKLSLLNNHLFDLIITAKNNAILNKESEYIQLDLTKGRLLITWNKTNGFIALTLVKLDVSVAHIKVNMQKILESFNR